MSDCVSVSLDDLMQIKAYYICTNRLKTEFLQIVREGSKLLSDLIGVDMDYPGKMYTYGISAILLLTEHPNVPYSSAWDLNN